MRIPKSLPIVALLLSAGWLVTGLAADTGANSEAKFCLPLITIDSIDIIDGQHIAFEMKNGNYYLNQLPQACPTLDHRHAIMYKTPLSSLCSLDIITVLDNIGGGFQSMGSCGLGKFQPVSKEEIERLKEKKPAQ